MRVRFAVMAALLLGIACKEKDSGIPFECKDGRAMDTYACSNIDLYAIVSLADLQGNFANDIWGWTDPVTGNEYAIVGLSDGVSFVDVTNPAEPIMLGKLPEVQLAKVKQDDDDEGKGESTWRDVKVYNDHAYIVTDAQPHGMQVFDLTKLREVSNPPVAFAADSHYGEFGRAHNIAINEQTGYAYAVGTNTYGGGLHIIDIQDPLNPVFAGFHSDSTVGRTRNGVQTGYVHDTQCVVYQGPDTEHSGKEICMNASETHMVIADVSNKAQTLTLGKVSYQGNRYAHQGWLTEDQSYFILNDELDEQTLGNTRTYIFDVRDLDNPELLNVYVASTQSIDHNLYIHQNKIYQSNYKAGLRILDAANVANGQLTEIAYFDTYPLANDWGFDGTWSNYPFFESGTIVVTDMEGGLFILKATLD